MNDEIIPMIPPFMGWRNYVRIMWKQAKLIRKIQCISGVNKDLMGPYEGKNERML